jgi:hypothetical protein
MNLITHNGMASLKFIAGIININARKIRCHLVRLSKKYAKYGIHLKRMAVKLCDVTQKKIFRGGG